jgi:MATE family multidrug resistance protein
MGRGDVRGATRAGWAGFVLVLAVTGTVGLGLTIGAPLVVGAYTSDAILVPVAIGAIGITAAMVIVDGGQGVMISALRGFSDALSPTIVYAVAFWVIGVPVAWLAGRHFGLGLHGLLWGLWLALASATAGLAWRFRIVTRRRIAA